MKKFLTIKEAADYLGISEIELQDLVDKGRISPYKIGGVYTRFKLDDLNSYQGKISRYKRPKQNAAAIDRIKDFFYFNDFYIFSAIVIIIILYFIFK